jgi:hypothetical protein
MSDYDLPTPPRPRAIEIAFGVFQRIVAVLCLVSGLGYWALLIGVLQNDVWRFDILPVHWKIATASLAVLWPVAGVGLWMLVSWGPVVWIVAAAGEIIMYGVFSSLYGNYWPIIVVHAFVALTYAVFRLVIYMMPGEKMHDGNF